MADEPAVLPQARDFGAFYRATVAPLRRYLARMTGNNVEAQDIAHDAYVRVFPTMQKRDLGKPQAFLFATARNIALDQLKRRTRSPVEAAVHAVESAADGAGVEAIVMAREEWGLMETAVAALPPGCRQVLLLRTVDRLSHEEIAQRLGLARSSVEKHLMRAARLLGQAMRRRTDTEANVIIPWQRRTGTGERWP